MIRGEESFHPIMAYYIYIYISPKLVSDGGLL